MSREKPLFAVLVETGGIRRGYRAMTYLAAWLIASNDVDHPASQNEFMAFWRSSISSLTRDRNALRASLPVGLDIDGVHAILWSRHRALVGSRDVVPSRQSVVASVGQVRMTVA